MNNAYEIIEKKSMPYIKSEATTFKHKSGAKIIYLKNIDENKVFSVSFKTPPCDNTGLFHIIEHSVLAGSKRYPIKEPFNELIKGSLFTYLNAMTFSDKTMYPIASCNDKDFYNLMNVYLDAVFFPKIYERKESFLQEAWNYKIKNQTDPIKYNGIVYNEMKGAYSDPLRVLDNITNRYLFSENTYRFDSGGDPDHIPELEYESFLQAHKKYYHPANSYIYFYGDMDIEKCLDLLHNDYLSKFDVADFNETITINKQKLLDKPFVCEGEYAIPEESSIENKNLLSASFIVGDYSNAQDYYGYKFLANILLGTPASPIKKAMIDCDMGEEILGGFDSDMLQTVFNITVKNSGKDIITFKETLRDILIDLVENGIDKNVIQSCMNKAKFMYMEEDYGYRPKGLVYNITILSSWLYGGDPFEKLNPVLIIDDIKKLAEQERYFENLIKTTLLNNNHCVYTVIKPKPGLNNINDHIRSEKLELYKKNLNENSLTNLVDQTKKLIAYQNKKDIEEDLKKMPFVELSDIKKLPENIPFAKDDSNKFDVFYTSLDTNGIVYTNLMFNTDKVATDKLYVIGILSYMLGKLSTENKSYEELSNQINEFLGGFSIEFLSHNSVLEIGKYSTHLNIRTKCTIDNKTKKFNIIQDIINKTLFNDEKRIKSLLNELKSYLQNMFLTSGNTIALGRAESYLNQSGRYKDCVTGISFFKQLKYILENFDSCIEMLKEDLKNVSKTIFTQENFMLNFTCSHSYYNAYVADSKIFYNQIDDANRNKVNSYLQQGIINEAFATSGKVQYNVLVGNYIENGFQFNGLLHLLSNIINTVYFMDEIRLKGGAYGFGANILGHGVLKFYSYRDPNLTNTYEVYKNVANFLKKYEANENEIRKQILGTINGLDRYMLPSEKGSMAFRNYLNDKTYDNITRERNEVLNAKWADIEKYIGMIEKCIDSAYICTVGDSIKLSQESSMFKIVHDIGV